MRRPAIQARVITLNHPAHEGSAESTVLGPFYWEGAPDLPLGTFPWNDRVAWHIHHRRKLWLPRGSIFIETLRFFRSDRDNRRHLIGQLVKYLSA
jgi:hypothetical protein